MIKNKANTFSSSFFEMLKNAEENYFWFEIRRRWIFDTVRKITPPPAKLLEIGCGTGNVISFLASNGYDATGCEYYDEALEMAWPGFEKIQGDALNLPFADRSFDVVCLFDVIEHVEDDTSVLIEAFRVLRKGGAAIVTVPARDELWSSVDEIAFHKRRYTRERLVKSLESANFSPLSMTYMFMALYLPMRLMRTGKVDVRSQFEISPVLNSVLKCWFDMERRVSGMISLPVGTSLLATAVKND